MYHSFNADALMRLCKYLEIVGIVHYIYESRLSFLSFR